MERRAFLSWMLSGAVGLPLRGVWLQAQATAMSRESVAALRALAPVLLPSALGAAGHDKVVADFVQWLAGYQPGAERSWGYGHPRRTATPAIATATYDAQLRALAERGGRDGLASLTLAARRTQALNALDAARVERLPGSPDGQHVLADFMSFFFNGNQAPDLVYRAAIRRASCRGLAGAADRPVAGD